MVLSGFTDLDGHHEPAKGVFLATWDRHRDTSGGFVLNGAAQALPTDATLCLWHSGVMTNRLELATRAAVPRTYPPDLVCRALHPLLGDATWSAIQGDWSALLWNGRAQELILLRDRMGGHGLYYVDDGKQVLISNRIEHLLDALPAAPSPNLKSLVAQVNCLPPAGGETHYQNINTVAPGCALLLGRTASRMCRYWEIAPQPLLRLRSDEEYTRAYRELLFSVVAGYADSGNTGITLSGGLDSTSVAAALRQALPHAKLTAFTWVSPSLPEADESENAKTVAERLKLDWVPLRHDELWPLSTPEGLVTSRDTPFLNYYQEMWIYTTALMQRMGIDVVFGGVSGDNLFGAGVYPYADMFLKGRWVEMGRQMRRQLAQSAGRLSPARTVRILLLSPLAAAYLPLRWRRQSQPVTWLRPVWHQTFQALTAPAVRRELLSPGRQQRLRILREPLLPHILERRNVLGADYGIEFRHPFMDHRLIEFAASLPPEQTMWNTVSKIIMRRAMRGYLPDVVLDKRTKTLPTAVGMRGLRELETGKVWALLSDMRAAQLGLVDEDEIRRQYNRYVQKETEDTRFFYTLTLEAWLRQHF